MEGSLEEGQPPGWERASAGSSRDPSGGPAPGRWMLACCCLRAQAGEG